MDLEIILSLLVAILWSATSCLLIIEYAPYTKDLKKVDAAIVFMIFLLGGPIFTIANILEAFLNVLLPEGWGNDDENFKGS